MIRFSCGPNLDDSMTLGPCDRTWSTQITFYIIFMFIDYECAAMSRYRWNQSVYQTHSLSEPIVTVNNGDRDIVCKLGPDLILARRGIVLAIATQRYDPLRLWRDHAEDTTHSVCSQNNDLHGYKNQDNIGPGWWYTGPSTTLNVNHDHGTLTSHERPMEIQKQRPVNWQYKRKHVRWKTIPDGWNK